MFGDFFLSFPPSLPPFLLTATNVGHLSKIYHSVVNHTLVAQHWTLLCWIFIDFLFYGFKCGYFAVFLVTQTARNCNNVLGNILFWSFVFSKQLNLCIISMIITYTYVLFVF
jgi:hypothetical protein